ncbi:hypothetical protein [Microbacterium oleivorans]|uniref:copper amine oxidase n=1 Tax=Microbacterium oleivorans TaxID=273677 RepID=UPI0009789611|nr:hypothetical protein [Microbacterium oleivorans]
MTPSVDAGQYIACSILLSACRLSEAVTSCGQSGRGDRGAQPRELGAVPGGDPPDRALVEEINQNLRLESTRIRNSDGHPIAYDLDHHNGAPYRDAIGSPYTSADVYVTEDNACERLAAQNPVDQGCASSVDMFANAQALEDPVLWVQVGFHHIPRDEDQPVMNEHWQGFALQPRSLTRSC